MDFIPINIPNQLSTNSPPSLSVENLAPIRTANDRLKDAINAPPIKMMLGNIWMSGELHLLFADTGVGKSIFAVAVANALSKGRRMLILENECKPLTVLYYDFELSDRQFLTRYSDLNEIYPFSNHLYVDNIDFAELMKMGGGSIEQVLFQKMRYDIQKLKADVMIIDNITYLNTQTTQKTDTALDVMRQLIEIKREFNMSILVLAHTPKIDLSSPLTINSLAGSKHLSNFADSVSAIGRSAVDSNLRYIKQVKPSRSAEILYDSQNVITCEVVKKGYFLTFDFIDFHEESYHLRRNESNEGDRESLIQRAVELKQKGWAYRAIAKEVLGDENKQGTISKWLKKRSVSIPNGNSGNSGNAL